MRAIQSILNLTIAGVLGAGSIAAVFADEAIIDATHYNGSFESEQTKQTSWDTVTAWSNWDASTGGTSTANNDSGCEPVSGMMWGFMQPGNAAYNLTDYAAQAGDEFDIIFDKYDTDSMQVALVYEDGSGQIQIVPEMNFRPTSITTGAELGTFRMARIGIPGDSPAVGRKVGIGLINKSAAYPDFDNFQLIRLTAGDRYHVDAARSGQGDQDGSSWGNAFASLQDALLLASSGDEVWVREGVYYPDEAEAGIASVTADDPEASFEIVSGVKVYGSFTGTETELSQRDTTQRSSILSGDLTQDDNSVDSIIQDDPAGNIVGSNSRTIVSSSDAWLDGFTLTANQTDIAYQGTGVLRRVVFQGNKGNNSGAVSSSGSLQITDCAFQNNEGGGSGALYIGSSGTATVDRCLFQGNRTTDTSPYSAGAVRVDRGVAEFRNSLFSGNTAGGKGAILATGFTGITTLINCTIAGNNATWSLSSGQTAGGVGVQEGASIEIYNSVIWGNASTDSISVDGVTTLESSLVEGLNPGGSNLDGTNPSNDPQFMASVQGINAPTTNGNYQLNFNSPLISAANASFLPADTTDSDEDDNLTEPSPLDLLGGARIQGTLDIGAYELDGLLGLAYFRASYGLNPDGSADFLDWSTNGLANILYFAFGLGDPDAATVDSTRIPQTNASGSAATFSYLRPTATESGIIITPYASEDLSIWDDLSVVPPALFPPDSTSIEGLGDGYEKVTLSYDISGGGRLFFRTGVSVSP